MKVEMQPHAQVLKVSGFITAYFSPYGPQDAPPSFEFLQYESTSEDRVVLQPVEFISEFTPPADMIPLRVKNMRERMKEIRLNAEEEVAQIEEKLQKLLALEHSA
tara:strand:+ start:469 stop:783 length:315 start_codon:yes stop_codon:yes gene_type:complete